MALSVHSVWLRAASGRAEAHSVATGTWGGENIILEVSHKGAQAEFDCAHGQITHPMVLNKRGDFEVAGSYTREHGGPVLRDEVAKPSPARYSGHVGGNSMTLTVTLEKEKLGPFTLTHGQHPMLRKCR
jgi:hypothetical protein